MSTADCCEMCRVKERKSSSRSLPVSGVLAAVYRRPSKQQVGLRARDRGDCCGGPERQKGKQRGRKVTTDDRDKSHPASTQ